MECKICGNSKGNRLHRVPELMFRTDESFDYLECGGCGSLHIVSIPADLARHYPAHYYAFAVTPKPVSLTAWLKSVRARHRFHPTLLGALLQRSFGPEEQPEWIGAVESLLEGPVLDVGCGQGTMLHALERLGFRNVTGVDPHAPDARHPRVKRCGVEDIEGEFSLVMFHHSLEHIPDVFGTLRAARGLLAADGRMIVRIPVAGGFAWRTYGIHWVALDAPRHLWLFSPPAFRHVAASAGLPGRKVAYVPDGRFMDPMEGKGRDYGIKFALPHSGIAGSLSYYESSSNNEPDMSLQVSPPSRLRMTPLTSRAR